MSRSVTVTEIPTQDYAAMRAVLKGYPNDASGLRAILKAGVGALAPKSETVTEETTTEVLGIEVADSVAEVETMAPVKKKTKKKTTKKG